MPRAAPDQVAFNARHLLIRFVGGEHPIQQSRSFALCAWPFVYVLIVLKDFDQLSDLIKFQSHAAGAYEIALAGRRSACTIPATQRMPAAISSTATE